MLAVAVDAEQRHARTHHLQSRARAAESAALFAACLSRGSEPEGAQPPTASSNRSIWRSTEADVALGAREVRHRRPRAAPRGGAGALAPISAHVARQRAQPGHAGVDLEVHADRPGAAVADLLGQGLDLSRVVDDRRQVVPEQLAPGAPVVATHDQDRRPDAGLAQLDALFQQGHAHAARPGPLERARHGLGAMTVAVRLQHAPHLGAAGDALQDAQVVAEIRQVDLGPGRPDSVRRHRPLGPEHPRQRSGESRTGRQGGVVEGHRVVALVR